MKFAIFAALIAITLPAPALAKVDQEALGGGGLMFSLAADRASAESRWVDVSPNSRETSRIYVDDARIHRSGFTAQYWIKIVHSQNVRGSSIAYTAMMDEINCRSMKNKNLVFEIHFRNGAHESVGGDGISKTIRSTSLNKLAAEYVCRK
jgi:hypothetical protein